MPRAAFTPTRPASTTSSSRGCRSSWHRSSTSPASRRSSAPLPPFRRSRMRTSAASTANARSWNSSCTSGGRSCAGSTACFRSTSTSHRSRPTSSRSPSGERSSHVRAAAPRRGEPVRAGRRLLLLAGDSARRHPPVPRRAARVPPARAAPSADARVDAPRTGARGARIRHATERIEVTVDPNAAHLLSPREARGLGVVPLGFDGDTLLLAVERLDYGTTTTVEALTGRRVLPMLTDPLNIRAAQIEAYGPPAPVGVAVDATGRPQAIGSLLVSAGLIDNHQLEAALIVQRRTGSRLGEVLLHAGAVHERDLTRALATQLGVPHLDVSNFQPEQEAVELVPEHVARRHRFVPLAVRDGSLFVAIADPFDGDAISALAEHTDLAVRAVMTSRAALDGLRQRLHSESYVHSAVTDLVNRSPEDSAYRVLTLPQKVVLALAALALVTGFVSKPMLTLILANAASVVFYTAFSVYKFWLALHALRSDLELPVTDEEVAALEERELPVYTILVPLYREAAVVRKLTAAIAELDYPRAKLDVKLIVEEDDDETIEALRSMFLPAHFRLVVVPDAAPKTKPKACNYGLLQAEGKYVVIYDAEDLPAPDQLKKIAVAFAKAEERIVCIQCKLNYYNRDQNLLTRWFTSEYSNWFDLLMPGLDAADAPIPLGGTSNHFVTEKLVEIGAWDPFNVTEDADLGIRLHRSGYKTAIIDSTTFEEANSEFYNWVRQRSRWVKGYIQTWLVHMRHPIRLWRQVGGKSWWAFQFMIGGTFFSFLINPLYWALTTIWALTQAN